MFCANCGKEIPEQSAFCPGCGKSVQGAEAPVEVKPVVQPAPTEVIPSHLALGIITTLLCCMPLGVVSIVYAAQVSGLVSAGKIEQARSASRSAKGWGIAALLVGLASILLYVIFYGVLLAVAANAD